MQTTEIIARFIVQLGKPNVKDVSDFVRIFDSELLGFGIPDNARYYTGDEHREVILPDLAK